MLPKRILSVIPFSIRIIRRLSLESLDGAMPLQQIRVLFLINEGKRQSEMAEVLQVSGAAISKIINQLVLKKYAIRSECEDRRCVGLTLTAEGKKVMGLVSGQIENRLKTNMKNLTKKELEHLSQGLVVLEKLMGQINEA